MQLTASQRDLFSRHILSIDIYTTKVLPLPHPIAKYRTHQGVPIAVEIDRLTLGLSCRLPALDPAHSSSSQDAQPML